jgi:AraC family transcriptional regulator of adaptative response/methylated-DNA-[protein]-cysteine methyltransferase
MTETLPDPDTLYAALLARDARFDGVALVCVTSTRIFCRLSCPARKPKRENCQFRASAEDCVAAGFRACKGCHPVGCRAVSGLA